MNTRIVSLLLTAGLALLAVPTATADVTDVLEDDEVHCALPTSWYCIKEWGDMVFEDEDGVLIWACGFVNGEPCGPYSNEMDYVCHTVWGYPCHHDQALG